jgi:hypothetical protein
LSGREVDDFLAFAKRLSRPPVTNVELGNVKTFLDSNTIAFLLFSKGGRIDSIIAELGEQNLANEHVVFGKSSDIKVAERLLSTNVPKEMPFLVCKNDNVTGDLQVFTGPFQYDSLNEWITPRTLPVLAEISMANWKQITQGPKLAVIIAVEDNKHAKYVEMMRTIASKYSEFQFGFLDAEEYLNFVDRKFGMKELPTYIVFQGKDEWYYFDGKSNQSQEDVAAFLAQIASGNVPKRGPGSGYLGLAIELAFRLIYIFKDNPILGVALVAMVLLPVLMIKFMSTGDDDNIDDKDKTKKKD